VSAFGHGNQARRVIHNIAITTTILHLATGVAHAINAPTAAQHQPILFQPNANNNNNTAAAITT
jgi:hypothetical protein